MVKFAMLGEINLEGLRKAQIRVALGEFLGYGIPPGASEE
jgi:hypothetical protein